MSFKFSKYAILSDQLLQIKEQIDEKKWTNIEEGRRRSAVSRAYYAVFNMAFEYLLTVSKDPDLMMIEASMSADCGDHEKCSKLKREASEISGKTVNELDSQSEKFNVHSGVRSKIRKYGSDGEEAADALFTLRDYRNKSDYNRLQRVDLEFTRLALDEYQRVVSAISRLQRK